MITGNERNKVYLVTPTYKRPDRMPFFRRMVEKLNQVAAVIEEHIIVEDDSDLDAELQQYLAAACNYKVRYFNVGPTRDKGHIQRQLAYIYLYLLLRSGKQGVVYNLDDDNDFIPDLLMRISSVQTIGLISVGNLGPHGVERPVLNNNQIVGWDAGWTERKFPVNMAGFVFNLNLLRKLPYPFWAHTGIGGESEFIERCLHSNGIRSFEIPIPLEQVLVFHNQPIEQSLLPAGRKPLRVAVVGCGWFARTAHLPALRQLAAERLIEVAALCSRSQDSLLQSERILGHAVTKKYTDFGALLADNDIDAVDLVLPTPMMAGAIRASLKAGKHVISEKPCAANVAQCVELLAEYDKCNGRQVWAVAENWRFKRLVQIIADVVQSGELGALQSVDFDFTTLGWQGDQGWRRSPGYDGGYLIDSGVHFAAMLRRVVGEFEEVSASIALRERTLVAETGSAAVVFQNNVKGSFRVSFASDEVPGKRYQLIIKGADGILNGDFRRGFVEIQKRTGNRAIDVSDDTWVQGGVYNMLRHCCLSIHAGMAAECSPVEAMKDVAVIEAMMESNRLGRPVKPASLYKQLNGCGPSIATYAGVRNFRPRHAVECSSISDVSAAITEASALGLHVRTVGTGYSWSSHLRTDDVCLRITGLRQILGIDTQRKTIRAGAGARIMDISRALAAHGLCLPSLSFVSEITIGGAIATATHGTSPKWGTLSDFVRSMKLVLASGEVITLDAGSSPDVLCAARVAVGMLGVIVEVELEAVDMPWVRNLRFDMSLADFMAQKASLLARFEHVWPHWILGDERVLIQCLETSPVQKPGFIPYVSQGFATWEHLEILPRNGQAAGPVNGVRMSMQYGVPMTKLEVAIDRIKNVGFTSLHPEREIEMKFLKKNAGSYLGPNADDDAVLFNIWWLVEKERIFSIFEPFEAVMRGLCARPHWGKLHIEPKTDYMNSAYPGWEKFDAVRRRLDPGDMFSIFRKII